MSIPTLHRLVGGEWRAPEDGRALDVTDPADVRRIVARVPAMRAADVPELYERAVDAVRTWRRTPALERAAILRRTAALLRERADAIAADLVAEMGKTRAEADGEVAKSADLFEFYASLARLPYGELLHDARARTETSARTEPVGVVLAITPWNDPLLTPARKLAPALFAGNAVILKPALDTPVVALHLARALDDAGLPAGVLGTAIGSSQEISGPLLRDERLDALTFTGSTPVGRRLRRELGDTNVRLQTEMGGKNASVVLADADLGLAVDAVAAASFGQAGQRCTATSRVVVERAVAGEFVAALTARARAARLGPGADPATDVGPLVSMRHRDSVRAGLERAVREGATLHTGGEALDEHVNGCFLTPAVLEIEDPAAVTIWREEVFGPVVVVLVVDGFEAALAAADDSAYGLAAAVYSRDLGHAHEFADRVTAGQVAVNLPTTGWDVHLPFGGFRDSGSPFKEQGREGLRFYTRVKTVSIGYQD
ncbi:aldehyde dehydrogenase family protein [Actinomadura sp. DC4]|uniref:aldehyde dehydrogenase family protein n=1 Tax=Actinomadura sp. DC4 TaxID=3055069 RepID=UPI0025B15721|nr:aldehyde dehydrogenase family protein [Actinomadura sp. DC4]MDN3359089.1 aldehyde dehydrogenase family protein [Actinomadura sp. DC4]